MAGYGEEDGAEDDDGVVVGARYYAYKEATLAMEQRLLKAMEYELNVEQPHVFMFHIVEVIKGGEALACAASAVLRHEVVGATSVVDDASAAAAKVPRQRSAGRPAAMSAGASSGSVASPMYTTSVARGSASFAHS